jgi:uncharacterized protein YjbI with pentapeptide repeats
MLRPQTDTTSQALAAPIRSEVATISQSLQAKRRLFIVNSLLLVYDSHYNLMDEEHPAKRQKSRWWPTSRGVRRIFAALIAVCTLLFTGVGALLFLISVSAVATLDNEILLVLGVATVVAAVVVLILVGQQYEWTGFGKSVQPKSDNEEIQPRKTLWDWLQLFIVPLALAAIGLWFAAQQDAHQQEIEEKRAKSDRHIEEQRAQDAALQAYLDQMSQLMLEGGLRGSKEGSEVRTLARARTRTVLGRLNSRRKGSVVQFLYEASLINKENPVVGLDAVHLRGADLSNVELHDANLSNAYLNDANLSGTSLNDANLIGAHLSGADLSWASLSGAQVSGADLSNANLNNAYLNEADLRGTHLMEANLSDATLRDAHMGDGAELNEANLSNAELVDANLSGAYLIDANLSGANLSGANLSGTTGVTEEQLEEQAELLEGATMPDGSIHH